jgi:stage II sporulation protein D
MFARTLALVLVFASQSVAVARAQEVRIGVLGLFHPAQLSVSAGQNAALLVDAGDKSFVIENSSSCQVANLKSQGDRLDLSCGDLSIHAAEITLASREGASAEFYLCIPGKIRRRYRGKLEVMARSGRLIAIVQMEVETAVASVVAAETLPDTPLEALKAQAIAARSYLLAGKGRHHDFDFCDTTHCQFLREPPQPGRPAAIATRATRGLILAYEHRVFAAMYTRSCSGRTHTPSELGMPASRYPYFSVACRYCREHPAHWQTRIRARDSANLRSLDEKARLQTVRRLGWDTIPGDDFTTRNQGGVMVVEGVGQGHGIGLCEAGARAMAAAGADFRQILAHYYPNAIVISAETTANR